MIAPSREEYEAWREEPIPQVLFAGLKRLAAAERERWEAAAWNGDLDPIKRAHAHAKVQTWADLASLKYDDLLGAAGLEEPRTTVETA